MRMRMRVRMAAVRRPGGRVVMIIAAGGFTAGIAARVVRIVAGFRLSRVLAAVVVHVEPAALEDDGRSGDTLPALPAALRALRLTRVMVALPHGKPV